MNNYQTVDEYISSFEPVVRERLNQIRETIRQAAPEATEKISYGIPTFVFHGNLIHFGGFPNHIGLYPGSVGIAEFQHKLKGYDTAKGTIRLPNDKPLPLDLIREITAFCVAHKLANKKQ